MNGRFIPQTSCFRRVWIKFCHSHFHKYSEWMASYTYSHWAKRNSQSDNIFSVALTREIHSLLSLGVTAV